MDEAVSREKAIDSVFSLLIPKLLEPGANHSIKCVGHGNSFWSPHSISGIGLDRRECITTAKPVVDCDDNVRDHALFRHLRNDAGIRGDDRSHDWLLELLADIHHPAESSKHVGEERSIQPVNAETLLNNPGAKIRVRRNAETPRPSRLLNTFDEGDLIHTLSNCRSIELFAGNLQTARIDRIQQRSQINRWPGIEFNLVVPAGS